MIQSPLESNACYGRAARLRGSSSSLAPEVLEPRRRQLRVAYGMLNGPMAEPVLNSPRVVAGVRQCVAAAVAEHVRMDRSKARIRMTRGSNQSNSESTGIDFLHASKKGEPAPRRGAISRDAGSGKAGEE
jgi:hypothetical protein